MGEKFLNDFLRGKDIRKCVYNGGNSFEGNQARKLLLKIDILEREVTAILFAVQRNQRIVQC